MKTKRYQTKVAHTFHPTLHGEACIGPVSKLPAGTPVAAVHIESRHRWCVMVEAPGRVMMHGWIDKEFLEEVQEHEGLITNPANLI